MSAGPDSRAPVIVGVGQVSDPPEQRDASPLDLMARAARLALADSGAGERLIERIASVGVVDCVSWQVPDPAALLAAELGIEPRETVFGVRGGTGPIMVLGDLCAKIAAGELDVALMGGAEAMNTLAHAMRDGRDSGWPQQPHAAPDRLVGEDRPPSHEAELAAGLIAPVAYYPLFENALRASAGRSRERHQRWLGELGQRFSEVGAGNPHAWSPRARGAEEIASASATNRLVSAPYTKLMNANIQVDQGAMLVVCSAEAAAAAGVPRERWVFVQATAGAHDHWLAGERAALDRSPAIAACAAGALEHAGLAIEEVAHLDLYSCFPSAVQIAARELGIDLAIDARPPTVTGGLTFAGGPGNNYVTHSLATLSERLRADPSACGLATAVGWYMTKHAIAVLSARPPAGPFAHLDCQAEVDALPRREVASVGSVPDGTQVAVEAYTALYDRDGAPTLGMLCGLLDDGSRAFASSGEAAALSQLLDADPLGRRVVLGAEGSFDFAE